MSCKPSLSRQLLACDFRQGHDIGQRPRLGRNASGNRRSRFQGLVDAHEIVVHIEQRHHVNVVLDLFREGVGEAGEPAHRHSHGEILAFHMAGGNVERIGHSENRFLLGAIALSRTKPGVILTFESDKGSMSMPCDRYDKWRDNLRAIALALEALRAVDRYGVTRGNEQYRGWARIEAPTNGMTYPQAREFIEQLAGAPFGRATTSAIIAEVCRALKIKHHPDRGGSHDTFVQIGQAESVLRWDGKGL